MIYKKAPGTRDHRASGNRTRTEKPNSIKKHSRQVPATVEASEDGEPERT